MARKTDLKKPAPMAYVFMGRSGSGKGTQVAMLKDYFARHDMPFLHIETGAFLRAYAKGDSYVQKIVKRLIEAGNLAPDPVIIGLWINYIIEHFTGTEQLIFDGAPRKLVEAVFLDSTMKFLEIANYKILNIEVSRASATARLTARARSDDIPSAIENRMNWFDKDVVPALEFFRTNKDCVVLDIDGEQTPDAVDADLMHKLGFSK
ncbi:MAG: nucleoside monophosphate kinase [Patescibacteria group bacterium]|nr:nucleoside monophosphate kinase [Patescibacteria group bacterium]MDE1945839.1 nucleoside monophosphate kinase [Patescibacteria group bacterium]